MIIKGIKLYQAVQINQKQITHLTAKAPQLAGLQGNVSMKFIENMGVLVETDTDAVLVSFNNLAAIFIEKDSLNLEKKEPKLKKA